MNPLVRILKLRAHVYRASAGVDTPVYCRIERAITNASFLSIRLFEALAPENQEHTEDCEPSTEAGNKTTQRYCSFDRSKLGQWCTPENYFGYNTTEPCIFVQMNRVNRGHFNEFFGYEVILAIQ